MSLFFYKPVATQNNKDIKRIDYIFVSNLQHENQTE